MHDLSLGRFIMPKLSNAFIGFTGGCPTNLVSINEKADNDYIEYINCFYSKWKEANPDFKSFDEFFVIRNFKTVIYKLLFYNPDYITFNLTDDQSIYIQSKINDNSIYLELYFDREFPEGIQLVVNVYKDKKPLLAFEGNIDECFSEIADELKATRLGIYLARMYR